MDPVFIYFIGGLAAGVLGSFLAARLMGVDRLWSLSDKPSPEDLLAPLLRAAKVYSAAGPSGLVAVAGAAEHPLLRYALRQVLEGRSPDEVRARTSAKFEAFLAADRRLHFAGRLLGTLSPVLGIAGMAGAMYLALSRLNEPTGSAAGLAVGVMLLMVGGNVIALFSRRLGRSSPQATSAGIVAGTMIVEAAGMIRAGAPASEIQSRLHILLGEAPAAPGRSLAA